MKKIVLLMLLVCMAGSCQGAQTDNRPAGEPYKWPGDAQDMKLGIGIWFYSPERADKVFKDDYLTAEQPFNEKFLDDLRPFKVIRFTDWNKIQFNHTSKWEQRPKKDVQPEDQAGAVAYEWMIQICNTLGADFWVNAPHMADDDYMHKLAQLIHDTLDPKLKCYVEYSNETWNSAFGNEGQFAEGRTTGQYTWCVDNGKRLGFSDNDTEAGALYHVYASCNMFKAFKDVYGDEMDKRVVKVLAGFTVDARRVKMHLRGLADSKVNVHGIQPDAYALGPYFGHDVDGDDPKAFAELRRSIQSVVKSSMKIKKLLEGTGMELVAYEGGQHILKNPVNINKDQRMYQLYCEYLVEMSKIYKTFLAYNNCSKSSSFGYFGAKEYTGQPMADAPKYRAAWDWIMR